MTQNPDQRTLRDGEHGRIDPNNQAAQDGTGAERNLSNRTVTQDDEQSAPPPQPAGANEFPENIQQDPNRDLSHVPGTFNPGNQAGKPVQGGPQAPARTDKPESPQDQKR
jgi:hypothetical protein